MSLVTSISTDDNYQGPLARFLNLLGFQLDAIRSEAETLKNVNDPSSIPAALLPALAQQLGINDESLIGMAQTRRLVAAVVNEYKRKGSLPGVQGISTAVTGWDATVEIGPNLVVLPDLVAQLDSTNMSTNPQVLTGVVGIDKFGNPAIPESVRYGIPYDPVEGNHLPPSWPYIPLMPYVDHGPPAQAWWAQPGYDSNLTKPLWSSLMGESPLDRGIPIISALTPANTKDGAPATASASTTLTLLINDSQWDIGTWDRTVWFTDETPQTPPFPGTTLHIATSSLPACAVGHHFSAQLVAAGGHGPYKWSVLGLPEGFSYDPNTGIITGDPTEALEVELMVTVIDENWAPEELIGPDAVASIGIYVWPGGIWPSPTMELSVHFWGAYGADLGLGSTVGPNQPIPVLCNTDEWTLLKAENIAVPPDAVWASLEVYSADEIMLNAPYPATPFPSNAWGQTVWGTAQWGPGYQPPDPHVTGSSLIVIALPQLVAGAVLPNYSDPRLIEITVQPERTNMLLNPSLAGGSTTGLTAVGPSFISPFLDDGIPTGTPSLNQWYGMLSSVSGGTIGVDWIDVPFDPLQGLTGSAFVAPNQGTNTRNVYGAFTFYDVNGTFISEFDGPVITEWVNSDQWSRPFVTLMPGQAPTNAVTVAFGLRWLDTVTGGAHRFGAGLLEQATGIGSYFDGSSYADNPKAADYLWANPGTQTGPSWLYHNKTSRLARLRSVLAGTTPDGSGTISPFSVTGFTPLASFFDIETVQYIGPQLPAAPTDTWGSAVWGAVNWSSLEKTGGWGNGSWSNAHWGDTGGGGGNGPAPPPSGFSLGLNFNLPAGITDVAYAGGALQAAGGTPPYSFSIVSGTLPPGLDLNPSTGAVTGTPTLAGTYDFTGQVTDANIPSANVATFAGSMAIELPLGTLEITTTEGDFPTGIVGIAYQSAFGVELQATGGLTPYSWTSESLPPGFNLSRAGVLSGTPASPGTYTITFTVIDSLSNQVSASFTLEVIPSLLWGAAQWGLTDWPS